MENRIPLIDIFFVFNTWTLIFDSKYHENTIVSGMKITLLDENLDYICRASITGFPMGNRNPNISTFHIAPFTETEEAKIRQSKYFRLDQ